MGRLLALIYGLACYAIFFAIILYAITFVGGVVAPKTIDGAAAAQILPPALAALVATIVGPQAPGDGRLSSVLIDIALLGVFAVQHSVMARPAFKRVWTKVVPEPVERSTYVLASSLALLLLFSLWRPLPTPVWSVQAPWAVAAIWTVFAAGWVIVLLSTFLISHFHLFGLSQVTAFATGRAPADADFRTPLLYRLVRHPIYLGFLLAFWAAPTMSRGHLLFSLATTGYIVVGALLEERDLVAAFGAPYRAYQQRVAMLIPFGPK